MGPFALTIQVGASHSILTSTETILSLSSKNSQSSQKGLLRSFTTAARNLTLMERIQRGITIENGKARERDCNARCASSTATGRRDAHAALTSARTRTRFVDIYAFVDSRSMVHVARAFSLLFCWFVMRGKLLTRSCCRGNSPEVDRRRMSTGARRRSRQSHSGRRTQRTRAPVLTTWRVTIFGLFYLFFWLSFFGAYF